MISCLFVIGLPPQSAFANSLSAKFLDIPYASKRGDFNYAGSAPFSIEFIGGEALNASDCFNLSSRLVRDFSVKWTIGGKSLTQSLDLSGGFVHTIDVTRTGLQCAYLLYGGGLFGKEGLYEFASNEVKVSLTLSLSRGITPITTASGFLLNPDYKPNSPEVIGFGRGDSIEGYKVISLRASNDSNLIVNKPLVTVCSIAAADLNQCDRGWGIAQTDGSIAVITNQKFAGQSAILNINWSYTNSTGRTLPITISIPFKIGQSTSVVPWDVLKQFSYGLEISPNLKCDSRATSGKSVNCTITPTVSDSETSADSVIKSELNFTVLTQQDTKGWKAVTVVSTTSGTSKSFKLSAPSGSWNRFQIKTDNGVLVQDEYSDLFTYGSLPKGSEIKLQFPNFILWNTPFQITARATKGNLQSCAFSMSGNSLGRASASKGAATITVSSVWSGSPGSSTYLYYSVSCIVSGKTVYGTGSVKGFK